MPVRLPTLLKTPTKVAASSQHVYTQAAATHVPVGSALNLSPTAVAAVQGKPRIPVIIQQREPRLFKIPAPLQRSPTPSAGSGFLSPALVQSIAANASRQQQAQAAAVPTQLLIAPSSSTPVSSGSTGTSVVSGDSGSSVPVAAPAADTTDSGTTAASAPADATAAATGFFASLSSTQKIAGGLGLAALALWYFKK